MSNKHNEEAAPRRPFSHTADKVLLIVVAVLMAATVVLNLLSRSGLMLIHAEWYVMLPLCILGIAVGWGMFAIWRRISRPKLKVAIGIIMAVVLFIIAMLAMTYMSMFVSLGFPQKHTVVSSGDYSVVVMRILDSDESRIEARRAARVAADPDADEAITADDWGYTYTAYAPRMGLFYKVDSLLNGEVHIGYASEAKLMVEWDDAVAHFYVENPGPGDGGEFHVKAGK